MHVHVAMTVSGNLHYPQERGQYNGTVSYSRHLWDVVKGIGVVKEIFSSHCTLRLRSMVYFIKVP